MDEAVAFAAERWLAFEQSAGIPQNINLRDRLPYFTGDFNALLAERFPALRTAPAEVILLIVAEGIASSGSVSRKRIELQLGIILPQR